MLAFQHDLGVKRDTSIEENESNTDGKDIYDLPFKMGSCLGLNRISFFSYCPCLPTYIDRDILCCRSRNSNAYEKADNKIEII